MKVERNRQLAKDIAVYGIGNLGNKFLVFLLFPVLTFFLDREELGSYDISLEAILFLLPIITLQMRESTFRLLLDANDASYRKHILSTTFFIECIIFVFVLVIAAILPLFVTIRYFYLIILSIYVYSLYELYLQAVRAVYTSTQYVLMSFISSFLTVGLVFLFYFVFDCGIESLFVGNIVARISAVLVIEIPRREIVRSISIHFFKKKYVREIFQYSIPMMWTAIAFGVVTSPGKFIANYFFGTDVNGIIAIAQKYMSILFILVITFHQAWQVTAVKNYKEHGSERFFSEIFNKYAIILCLLVACISFGLRSFKSILMGPAYYQGVDLIYIYCVSAVFHGLALFFEITYQCTKQTSKLLYSIVSCAALSLPLTVVLTKYFGLMGMVSALTISYAYLFIFRYIQTKSTLPIRFSKEFSFSILGLVTGGILFYCTQNNVVDYLIFFVASLLLCYFLFISRKYVSHKNENDSIHLL